ncbi:hypothetical protein EVAR_62132_1 [Eumeta japonica]|uniref:Uncharacterized protein n=1 Tax=Eumeta variegata TaxID=151549 RepID=A0A4C1ZHX0_EUMVA|nr:hypothetical protein EVAR_62132_1 [Eumeta japonica]
MGANNFHSSDLVEIGYSVTLVTLERSNFESMLQYRLESAGKPTRPPTYSRDIAFRLIEMVTMNILWINILASGNSFARQRRVNSFTSCVSTDHDHNYDSERCPGLDLIVIFLI